MDTSQSKALCFLLSLIIVILFVMLIYRTFSKLEGFEHHMLDKVEIVKEEFTINDNITNILNETTEPTETDAQITKKMNESKKKLEEMGVETFQSARELEEFHNNLGKQLEETFENNNNPPGNTETKTKMDESLKHIKDILDGIEEKMYDVDLNSIESPRQFVAKSDGSKAVSLFLQEYAPGGSPTDMYFIPQTQQVDSKDQYTLMCLANRTVIKRNKDRTYELDLLPCKFQGSIHEKKQFLFKTVKPDKSQKDNKTKIITQVELVPVIDKEEEHRLFVKIINRKTHSLEIHKKDFTKSNIDIATYTKVFTLTKPN